MAFMDVPSRLEDIPEAIRNIQSFITDKSLDDYRRETMLRLAIERCVEIISEASRHVPSALKDQHPTVPWRQIADIGNVLRHAYPSVEPEIIWEVATRHVTPLRLAVRQMLDEVGDGERG